METTEIQIPETLSECFKLLPELFEPYALKEFKNDPEKDYIKYHHNLGRWLRNNWGLWKETKDSKLREFFVNLGLSHADDMSGVILQSFHRYLNEKPLNVEGQIKDYQDFWKEKEGD